MNSRRQLILVCNAHLDPVWLWSWEEGLAETLSTFRAAARFCNAFKGFVFNHNEALLYQWIETHEPSLFARIQRLVRKGQWHIMGGWYLQPDCNLPCGESFVRQILLGKTYFQKKFKVDPKTAVNFDSFGHSKGLVQILKKSGYSSYLFCRPDAKWLPLPENDFTWAGYDGSEILAHRAGSHYNSEKGRARKKIQKWISENPDRSSGLLLWGIGNHGGGPSYTDLNDIQTLITGQTGWRILHGTPEQYFNRIPCRNLPRWERDLNPWAVGCYTSMARIKQKHRLLENMLFATEKMVSHAFMQGFLNYPKQLLEEALKDCLFCEFHDILAGSSIQEVEDQALCKMDHGLEILARLRSRAFFALLSGEPAGQDGEFLLFVYNPHPFPFRETIVFEFQPPEPNFDPDTFWLPRLSTEKGEPLSCQLEKESSNISTDQRKRVVFQSLLQAGRMNRFSVRLVEIQKKLTKKKIGPFPEVFRLNDYEAVINPETGLIDRLRIHGIDYTGPGAFGLCVMKDDADPWGMRVRSFKTFQGRFSRMRPGESARFAGVKKTTLPPVRIIEDGPIRTVVEALFRYNLSYACVHYELPKHGSETGIVYRIYWNEKDAFLKVHIPTAFPIGRCMGQAAYGVEDFDCPGDEHVAQKWVGVISRDGRCGLTIINDRSYGFDYGHNHIRLSLLRAPAYAGHPVDEKTPIVPQDRFRPRIDQGEHLFRFWITGGGTRQRFELIDREALIKNEPPFALVSCPSGAGEKPMPNVLLDDTVIQMTALKMAEIQPWLIARFFNPTGEARTTHCHVPCLNLSFPLRFKRFEIKTIALDLKKRMVFPVDLMEKKGRNTADEGSQEN
jgi:alpha-mannosidase